MEPQGQRIGPLAEIGAAFRSLLRPPLLTLFLLNCVVSAAIVGISVRLGPRSSDDIVLLGQLSSYVLDAIGLYVQIAVILAAATEAPASSADLWLRAAFKHRCFWRFLGATILEVVLVLLGALVFVVGAVVVGGMLALAQAAVVLERRSPAQSLRRSAELTAPARREVAVVFSILLLTPIAAAAAAVFLGIDLTPGGQLAVSIGSSLLSITAAVALTRMFVKLGGASAPPVQTLLYKGATRPR